MRLIGTVHILLVSASCFAQTGPGGVGSSTNNVLWLRANSGVAHSSGAVSQWNDQSGNNNHAYLPGSIPTATPSLVTNSVNGYPSLDFDGTDDQLWVNDAASLDLTQWHFFIVVTVDLQKDYNAWMVKGNDGQENYEMLSYTDGNIHTPTFYTDGTRTFPSSAAGQVTTTAFDVIEYSYSTPVGRDVYKNATNIVTDNESKTPQVNNLPLYIANERSTTGRNVNGDIAEVVAFNAPLNSTQRIIVNNYLAAKYGRTLGANDIYVHDNAGNGNYDHDVAGIGRISAGNLQTDSRGSGLVRINNATGLGDNEFLIWGHDNRDMDAWGVTDFPPTIQGRVARVWRVSEVSSAGAAVDVGNVDITFDLAGMGAVTTSDLRLLVDTDNDGIFADETPISGATNPSGTLYRFAGVSTMANNRRFTIGTANAIGTPLPIELIAFSARPIGPRAVRTWWSTATESNNAGFQVERSLDLQQWEVVADVDGAGSSSAVLQYEAFDEEAPAGTVYYRLRQTDLDGRTEVFDPVVVRLDAGAGDDLLVYPNPIDGPLNVVLGDVGDAQVRFQLVDADGREVIAGSEPMGIGAYRLGTEHLAPGSYILCALLPGQVRTARLVR